MEEQEATYVSRPSADSEHRGWHKQHANCTSSFKRLGLICHILRDLFMLIL